MKFFFSILILTFIFFGVVGSVFAQGTTLPPPPPGTSLPPAQPGTVLPPQPVRQVNTVSVQNPLKADNITELFEAIIDILLVFAIPLIVFFIIYAGFMYVTARGNESTISKAHMALLYALIGGVLILGAKVLIEVIGGTVDALR